MKRVQFLNPTLALGELDYDQQLFENYDESSRRLPSCCIAFYKKLKRIVPLKNVEYKVHVRQSLAAVDIIQTFENNEIEPRDIEYLFSIDPSAVFTKLEIQMGNQKLYGTIKEKKQAKQEYNQGVKDGKTMVYSEQDDEFPDIMRVQLGNLEPNQQLNIIFQYIVPLKVCVNEFWRLEIDPIVNPRYQLSQFQSSKNYIKLNTIVDLHQYNPNHKQNITIRLELTSPIIFCKSPTHTIISDLSAKSNTVEIVLDPSVKQNFDCKKTFLLLFADEKIHEPKLYLTHTNNDALNHQKYCCTLSFIPKFNPICIDDAYQAFLDDGDLNSNEFNYPQRGEYIFLLDRSGSMSGTRINKAKEALILFLKSLPTDSYFNIISFGSNCIKLYNKSQIYSNETLKYAIKEIEKMSANMGGTEIMIPLQNQIYNLPLKPSYSQNIFILTDGEVTPDPVIELVRAKCKPQIRVYTLGIGNGCSKYLIEKVAYVGNGKFHFVADDEDLNKKVIDLLQDSITPYLEQIQLNTSIQNYHCITPNPSTLVCLRKNTQVTIQILFPTQDEQIKQINISFDAYDPQIKQRLNHECFISLDESKETDFFHKLAAFSQINSIENAIKYKEKTINGILMRVNQIKLQDLINISITNQVLSRSTAFICEVKDMADEFKQQKNDIYYYHPQSKQQEKRLFSGNIKQQSSMRSRGGRGGFQYQQQGLGGFQYQQQGQLQQFLGVQQLQQGLQIPSRQIPLSMQSSRSRCSEQDLQIPKMEINKKKKVVIQNSSQIQMNMEIQDDEDDHFQQEIQIEQNLKDVQYEMQEEKDQDHIQQIQIQDQAQHNSNIISDSNRNSNSYSSITSNSNNNSNNNTKIVPYIDLLKYAEINGEFDKKVLSYFKQIKFPGNLDEKFWICIFILCYLEYNHQQDREAWQLIFKKSINYLSTNKIKYQDHKQQAFEIIQKL